MQFAFQGRRWLPEFGSRNSKNGIEVTSRGTSKATRVARTRRRIESQHHAIGFEHATHGRVSRNDPTEMRSHGVTLLDSINEQVDAFGVVAW